MTLYIGVDFHPHQQTLAWCDVRTGETKTLELINDIESVRSFYSSLPEPAIVGVEASAKAVLRRRCHACVPAMFFRCDRVYSSMTRSVGS